MAHSSARTQYDTASSLDGFVATPDHELGWVWFTSRELPTVEGADVRCVHGDVRPVHAAMAAAAAGRNVWIVGGGELAGQFLDADLLDERIVQVVSVTLGVGVPLLPRRVATPPRRIVSATRYGAAWVELRDEVPKDDA